VTQILKLKWLFKKFPKVDYGGFWICYAGINSASFDTKSSSILIFSVFGFFWLFRIL